MRSEYSKDTLLLAAAKKKPRLQVLIDGLPNMTEADIDQLGEQLWIREALKILKQTGGKDQKQRLQDILHATIKAEQEAALLPKPTYEVRIWDIDSQMIGSNKHSHSWKIEVENGDSFCILDDNKVKFGDSLLTVDDFEKYPLMQGSKFVGYMTLDNYRGFHRALLNQKHKL